MTDNKEYIEREALLAEYDRVHVGPPGGARKLIAKAPAADVVEVVRCGQCKHWKINPCNLYGGYCRYCDNAKIDHFCSYGERKTT